jgi:hypothetical protein
MVRHWLKGFRKDKDPTGWKHSASSRGISYAQSFKTPSKAKFSSAELLGIARSRPEVYGRDEPSITLPGGTVRTPPAFKPEEPSLPGARIGQEAVQRQIQPEKPELLSSESLEARPIEERREPVQGPPAPISYEKGVLI